MQMRESMIKKEAFELKDKIIFWRRQLHQIPETGLKLPQTQAYLCRQLKEMGAGFRVYEGLSAIETIIEGKQAGKTIALRTDMDALPIQEMTGLEFASENGCMHACGHDAHMAMMLGTVQLLMRHQSEIKGRVKCLFQPGEEGYGGARKMIEEGALDNPYVEAVLGLHVTNSIPELREGQIGLKPGKLMAGSDSFAIQIRGKGGHISDTVRVVNPIYTAAETALKIREISEKYQKHSTVVSPGVIKSGTKENAVSDTALLQGSVRTFSKKIREEVLGELERFCREQEKRYGISMELSVSDCNACVVNDSQMTDEMRDTAKGLFPDGYTELESSIMASEDICYFFQERKGVYFHLGCGHTGMEKEPPLHSAYFQPNEEILWRGTAVMAQGALDWLNRHSRED